MGRFIFIAGGARSGKSKLAVGLAKEIGNRVVFVATCKPKDKEMAKRISKHKRSRPQSWKTIEEGGMISHLVRRLKGKYDAVIIDCLGLLLSNLMTSGLSSKRIEDEVKSIAKTLSSKNTTFILVSNDVGSGIVPDNRAARRFRDLIGLANQIMAQYADDVYLMQLGIKQKIK